jgi:hypothetical protein
VTVGARSGASTRDEAAVWQRVEFGSYTADLPLWEELAGEGDRPTAELGAGAGRVALHLARRGVRMLAIEREPELLDELANRARADGFAIETLAADASDLGRTGVRIDAALAPLHLIQQIGPDRRRDLLGGLASVCGSGATIGLTVVDEESLFEGGIEGGSVPDMVEIDGWVYSSEPLWVQVGDETITVRRLRQRVAPGGEIERSVHDELLHRLEPTTLEAVAEAAGLTPRERRPIRSGPAEADSIAVILERP